jgi:predicted metal-dependent phosphotriesterase family hydrolase
MAVMTASGEVNAEELGWVLPHEHIFLNMMSEYREGGVLNDMELMTDELSHFHQWGGGTVIEVSTAELTRGGAPDPAGVLSGRREKHPEDVGTRAPSQAEAVREAVQGAGLKVVLSTGHYRDPYLDGLWFDRHGVNEIAETMIRDIEVGFPDVDARAGIIGEIGADKWFLSAREERGFRAAARAQQQTGVAITTHANRWPVGIQQLELLMEEGVPASAVIIGHCDTVNLPDYHEYLASQGAYVQFDTIRRVSEYELELRARQIKNLVGKGFEHKVLLSHDVCRKQHLVAWGGGGYSFIRREFTDRLRKHGVSEASIERMLVENPQRVLSQEDA